MVNDNLELHEDRLDAIIWENEEYGKQVRFTVSEFREKYYMGIREYYLSFEGEWLPTKNGMSFPYTLDSMTNFYAAFVEILSKAQVLQEVRENYGEKVHKVSPE